MPTQIEADLRREIVEIGRRVYAHFLVAANDGNISVRLDGEAILVTPTGVSKGFMTTEDIIKVSLDGLSAQTVTTDQRLVTEADVLAVPVGGRLSAPQEALITPLARQVALERHVTLDKAESSKRRQATGKVRRPRPGVRAVVHTHAPAATAFALTDIRLDEPLLPEVVVSMGPVAKVPYARSGTEELPRVMAPYLADHDAFLLANHGAVTVGSTLEQAYFQMERLELYARIRLAALKLGPARALPPEEVAQLAAVWEQLRKST
jgi:L-fuculose-phosphate aldolase